MVDERKKDLHMKLDTAKDNDEECEIERQLNDTTIASILKENEMLLRRLSRKRRCGEV